MNRLNELTAAFPACAAYVAELDRLRAAIDAIPIVEFFEPKVAILQKEDAPGELLELDGGTLTSWAAHLSFGARVRMRSLEDAFISELLQKRLFPAMAMVRAHMETAAFATYGLERVGACADTQNWEAMKKVIPQMLFGTAYKLERRAAAIQYLMELSAEEPVRIMKMIEALDRFVEQTDERRSSSSSA